jgi:hypothetical protein
MTAQEKVILRSVLDQQVVFEEIPLDVLRIDMAYQDRPRKTLVNQIATQFSEVMFGNLVVSKRPDNSLYVVDGATRKLGLEAAGQSTRSVRCQVIATTGQKQEALLFKHYNCNRKIVPLNNRLNAEGIAGINKLRSVVMDCGFKLVGSGRYVLKGVGFLLKAHNLDDGDSLKKTLRAFRNCWDGKKHRLDGQNVLAVAVVYYSQRFTPDEGVRKVLASFGPDEIERNTLNSFQHGRAKESARLHPADRWRFAADVIAREANRLTRGRDKRKIDITRLASVTKKRDLNREDDE